jgi:AcrR family transcriptional regulator
MKPIPARTIRAVVEDIPGLRPDLTPRMEKARDHILEAGTRTFAALGRKGVTMRALAKACWMSRDRIYFHYLDVDCLLEAILFKHLQGIIRAMGEAGRDPAARRAAYFRYTHGPGGGPTREHGIFIFERGHLPPDIRPNIEDLHAGLGPLLCPEQPERVLTLLVDPSLEYHDVEHRLANPEADQPALNLAEATDLALATACAAKGPQAATSETEPELQLEPETREPESAGTPPLHPRPPEPCNIHHIAGARPLFSGPPRPRTMASLLTPIDDPLIAGAMPNRAVAAPSTS